MKIFPKVFFWFFITWVLLTACAETKSSKMVSVSYDLDKFSYFSDQGIGREWEELPGSIRATPLLAINVRELPHDKLAFDIHIRNTISKEKKD